MNEMMAAVSGRTDAKFLPYRTPFIKRLRSGFSYFPSVYVPWMELRSCFLRLKFIRNSKTKLMADLGPVWERQINGKLERCESTERRKQDLKRAFESRDWGTILDNQLFLEGWEAGVRYRNSL